MWKTENGQTDGRRGIQGAHAMTFNKMSTLTIKSGGQFVQNLFFYIKSKKCWFPKQKTALSLLQSSLFLSLTKLMERGKTHFPSLITHG